MENTFRMLRPGGIFRLVVPDLESRARKYLEKLSTGDASANSWFMRTIHLLALSFVSVDLKHWRGASSAIQLISGCGMKGSMAAALKKVGFTNVRRCHFNDSADQTFRLVEDPGRFYDNSRAKMEECAMELIKPG